MIFYSTMSTQVNSIQTESRDRSIAESQYSSCPPPPPPMTMDNSALRTSPAISRRMEVPNLREDDITVRLDYQPPPETSYYVDTTTSTRQEDPAQQQQQRTTNRGRSSQYEYVLHHGRFRRRRRRQDESFFRFYSRHWFGQCIAALLTGVIFMSIGIVFVTTEITSPYIGVMFMLVSLPSFFMSLHMIRTRIRQQRLRRIYLERQRRRMARRRRRRNGNNWHRSNAIPCPDLPPSYDNFGFTDEERANVSGENLEPDATSLGSASDISDCPPPSYDEDWEKDSLEDIDIKEEDEDLPAAEKIITDPGDLSPDAQEEIESQTPTSSRTD